MKTTWSPQALALLKRHYGNSSPDDLVEMLKRPISGIYSKAAELGLHKSEKYMRDKARKEGKFLTKVGKPFRFKPGQNPWNAGRSDIRMSPATEFKKGDEPANTLHDGAITIRTERSFKTGYQKKYKWIRIAKGKWEMLNRHVWKKASGEIPKGNIIRFIDGDTMNCSIENLECITKTENARRNYNKEKSVSTIRLMWKEGEIMNGSAALSAVYVAGLISEGDRKLREIILRDHQDLIEIKRTQLLINRKIKKYHEKQDV